MIKLEVLDSNDFDRLGNFQFFKDLIYVGSNHDADLFLPIDDLKSNHIFLEIADGKLLAHLGRNTEYILINGKRTTSFKTLKAGDVISLQSLEFKIDSYHSEEISSISDFLKRRVSESKENNPELMELLKSFGDEL